MYKVFYQNFTGMVDYMEFYKSSEKDDIVSLSTENKGTLRIDKLRNMLIEENDNELGKVLAITDGTFKELSGEEYNLLVNYKMLTEDDNGYSWYIHEMSKTNEIINGLNCFVLTFVENKTGNYYSDNNTRIGYIPIQEVIRYHILNPGERDKEGRICSIDYTTVVEKEVTNDTEDYTEHLDIEIDLAFTREKWELPFSTGESTFCTIEAYVEQMLDEDKYNNNRSFTFDIYGSEMLPYRYFENAGIIKDIEEIVKCISQITGKKYTFHVEGLPVKTILPN